MKDFLEKARKAYYEGEPFLSDEQYDALESVYGELDSPGYNLDDGIPHFARMYSLQKFYEGEGKFPDWYTDPVLSRTTMSETPKLDGAAISILYVEGILTQVLTRGDGYKGTNITQLFRNNKTLKKLGIPNSIPVKGKVLQIVGEIAAPKSIANARNYAAGALSLKNLDEFNTRDITFVAYDAYPYIEINHTSAMFTLSGWGFNTVKTTDCSIFPTDGKVIRIDKYDRYESRGFTSKYPKGAFALKERTEGLKTKVLDVVWQTGKSGKVTPVAILEPIEIDGAIVSRATLNNIGFIQALDIELGDEVMVERSGGIIPRIICKA